MLLAAMRNRCSWSFGLALLASIVVCSPLAHGAPKAADVTHWAGKRLDPNDAAPFAIALLRDAGNNIWVGTEDKGVWRFDSQTQKWRNFTTKDGLGDDNAYALATDRLGRIWAGHLRSGVSVYNGVSWKNYGVGQGLDGERVFALAVSPSDGDVWIAHNAGLTRYSVDKNTWTTYTKSSGLPSAKISCLAFDSLGNIYVGTQADGLAIGRSADNYQSWTTVAGAAQMPDAPLGEGIPSNLINDVLVSDTDVIYAATPSGLAQSVDFGAHWTFVRGRDWKQKLDGLYQPRAAHDVEDRSVELLREDYVSNIAEDERGLIWLGYRLKGFEVRRPLTGRTLFSSEEDAGEGANFPYVSTLLPLGDGTALIASYGDGLSLTAPTPPFLPNEAERAEIARRRGWKALPVVEGRGVAPFPTVAGVPTADELDAMSREVEAVPSVAAPAVVPLSDDWQTQGDWLGRYGRDWALLCASTSPGNYEWGAGATPVPYDLRIDPREKGNALRYWVHWLQTENPRALELAPVYADSRFQLKLAEKEQWRRQSEVDDNGESYPLTKEGPDIYASLQIPDGQWVLGFYNHNKDGHDGYNRARDYAISLRLRPDDVEFGEVSGFDKWPEVARNRQRDFWGGVYQKYLVSGPCNLVVRYAKNNSFNTILAGIFLDPLETQPKPYFRQPETFAGEPQTELPGAATVNQLWSELDRLKTDNPAWWASEHRRIMAPLSRWLEKARLATTTGTPQVEARLGECYYWLDEFPQWEALQRKRGLIPARDIETSLKYDQQTRWFNGDSNFSGRGRQTVVGYLARQSLQAANPEK